MLREQTYPIRPGVFVHLHVAACECDSGTPGYGFVLRDVERITPESLLAL